MAREVTYAIAPKGLATSFAETELPPQYSTVFKNLFINAAGGAEQRQGVRNYTVDVPGNPDLTGFHELVTADGSAIRMVSGEGNIWRDDTTSWTQVYSGMDTAFPCRSVQSGSRLIFYNGVDRNFFTEDGESFSELHALISVGTMADTSATGFDDANVENWLEDSDVAVNDVVFNATLSAYGVVNAIVTASGTTDLALQHTGISTSALGIGNASRTQQSGDSYQLIDTVELNIIPTDVPDNPDNVAVATGSTSAAGIAVSGITWSGTEIKVGDFVRNTTRAALTTVTAVGSGFLGVKGIAGQTAGDSLVFLKSAMPIATKVHNHFGRTFYIDARDQRQIPFSGPNDSTDMARGGAVSVASRQNPLQTTFSYGGLQPAGDKAIDLVSYQRFLIVAGGKYIIAFSGDDPDDRQDFVPVGMFPQGVVAADSLISIGNDAVFVTRDGVQTISLVGDASTLGRSNISEAIKTTLRDLLTDATTVQAWHYPRRSWFCVKVDSQVYVFNYTSFFGVDNTSSQGTLTTREGSWSLFDGKFARQNFYSVTSDGRLVSVGPQGKVYQFDQGDYTDDSEVYETEYRTGWLTLSEPRRSARQKQLHYIKPLIDAGGPTYTIRAEANFDNELSSDTIVVPTSGGTAIGDAVVGSAVIGGASIKNEKLPLRVRGEAIRLSFQTPGGVGPNTLSRYTLYHTVHGKR